MSACGNTTLSGNIFACIPAELPTETFETLFQNGQLRIERIVSKGHASPEGYWYDQDWDEWVLLLQGAAGLLFEGEAQELAMRAGDYLLIPAHRKHRVAWTEPSQETVWLALHMASHRSGA